MADHNSSTIDTLVGKGLNIFRIPILMERIIPTAMTGTVATAYLSGLTTIVNYITNTKSSYAIIDSQNFGRYYGNIITSTSDFEAYWKTLATQFKSNSKVIFDCNNEFHDEPSNSLVVQLNQACINGVRAAGATSQYIFVEGTSYTGAWTWYLPKPDTTHHPMLTPPQGLIWQRSRHGCPHRSGEQDRLRNAPVP